MSTGNQKTPTTTSTTTQPVSAAATTATAEPSSADANQSSQNEAKANGMPSNDEMKIESTMDNEESVQLTQEQQVENRTNATPPESNGKHEDHVNVRKDEKEDAKNGEEEAQCDSVRPDGGGVGVDGAVDGDVRQVNGGKIEKCNEIDMNDSNCDSSDNLNANACRQHRTETTETTSAVAVTVKNTNESESKASVNCANESNNNDIIDAPKIECSEMGGLAATNSESNENSIKSAPIAPASATTTTSDALDVKNDAMRAHESQAMDKGGGGRRDAGATEVPRNAISVIAESKIKKTCDLFDEHTRANGPEHNSITSSVVETATATAMADKQKHSNDNVIESTAKLYERKVIVSPPKSSVYHQSQPVVVDQKSRPTSSMYVNVPDFTKQMHTAPPPPPTSTAAAVPSAASSLRDLSPLRMKPPDFSKLCRTSELHVTNPDFTRAYNRVVDARPKARALTEVNASNFAEISKKYNYVSDLQLKNPLPVATTSSSPSPAPSAPPSMYVRPPDFSSSKVRSRMENESTVEEPAAHVIRKPKFRIQADSSSKSSTAVPATPVHNEFPQISHDVTMSLVSPHRPQQVTLYSRKISPLSVF